MCSDDTIDNIVEEQYALAKHCNINILDSNIIPDFERKMIIGKLLRDVRKEKEEMNKGKKS